MKNFILLNFLLIFFLFSCSNRIFSQKDFKPGYLITTDHDTVYGFINVNSKYANSNKCEYKKNINSNVEMFNPFEIYAYGIENENFYISKEILINKEKKRVFLEYLIDGIVNLYYWNNKTNNYYFIEKRDTIYQLSNDEIEIVDKYNIKYLGNSNSYKGYLKYLFQESPELYGKINTMSFSMKPLISITEDYHNSVCKDYECINYTKNTNLDILIEPYFGISMSRMGNKFSSDYLNDLKPDFGINFRFNFLKTRKFWNYIIGINFSSNHFQDNFISTQYNFEEVYLVNLKYPILRIPLILEYSLPSKKIQPTISLGYNNVFILSSDLTIDKKVIDASGKEIIITEDLKHYNYNYGFIGGIGIKYHLNTKSFLHFIGNFELRLPSTNSNYFLDYQKVTSFIFNIGYCQKIKR